MSFSSTLYRISEDLFCKVKSRTIKSNQLVSKSKGFVTFQDSTDAILFLLKKRTPGPGLYDVDEIFFPKDRIGSVTDEEFQKLVDTCNYAEIERISSSTFYFLSPDKVITLNSFLSTLNTLEVKTLYDSEELNSNNIYPSLWTPEDDNQKAYNLNHIQNDLESLKTMFEHASTEKDYILAFNG